MNNTPQATPLSSASLSTLRLKAKLLLLALLALFIGSGAYLLYARGVFETTQELVLVADDSEGVSVGMGLTFSGFPIGRVQRIELAPSGDVHIVVLIPEKDAHWLRESSIFTMERNVLGAVRLRAFTGILDAPLLPNGAVRSVLKGDAMAEIPQIVSTLRDIINNVEQMTDAQSPLASTLESTSQIAGGLAGNRALGRDSPVVAMLNQTESLLKQVESTVAQADRRLFSDQGLMLETQRMLADVRGNLLHVDAILKEAKGIASNARVATEDLDVLRAQVETSLKTVESLVSDIQRKWPFGAQPTLDLP
jgi:phospholipid/cholesterol/gamma-HCH transport system substrate-binding protein